MNFKMIEAQTQALVPVIRDYVADKLAKLEASLRECFDKRIDDVQRSIPEPFDREGFMAEIKALIPEQKEIDLSGYIKAEDVEAIVEKRQQEFEARLIKTFDSIPIPKDGADGKSVTVDDIKPFLMEQIEAIKAEIPQVKDGKDGINGRDGKDAMAIEILPCVDMEKTYPRGTFALHDGGVIRSYQQTIGQKGWETAWNGVKSIDAEMEGNRNIIISLSMTDGTRQEKRFSFPAMIYRNIYKDGEQYQQGDVVTFGGSLWHADKDTDTKPGMKDSDWSLCAKKGRDGKDK